MSSVLIETGELIPLSLVLDDGDETKFPRASLYAPNGGLITRLALVHQERGVYIDYSYPMPASFDNVSVLYEVFEDAGFTTAAKYYLDLVTLNKDKGSSEVVIALNAAIATKSQLKATLDNDDNSSLVASDDKGASTPADNISAKLGEDTLKSVASDTPLVATVDEDNLKADKVE